MAFDRLDQTACRAFGKNLEGIRSRPIFKREIEDQWRDLADALKRVKPLFAPEERRHVATGEAQSDALTGAARPRRTERNPW